MTLGGVRRPVMEPSFRHYFMTLYLAENLAGSPSVFGAAVALSLCPCDREGRCAGAIQVRRSGSLLLPSPRHDHLHARLLESLRRLRRHRQIRKELVHLRNASQPHQRVPPEFGVVGNQPYLA